MQDQRSVRRMNTSLNGEISIDGAEAVTCVVSNLSRSGAKLNVVATVPLPSTFQLRAADLGLDVSAKMIWRTADEVGVRFPMTRT